LSHLSISSNAWFSGEKKASSLQLFAMALCLGILIKICLLAISQTVPKRRHIARRRICANFDILAPAEVTAATAAAVVVTAVVTVVAVEVVTAAAATVEVVVTAVVPVVTA
jgi:hypothetical protein